MASEKREGKIDLNRAGPAELEQIEGIDPQRARLIVEHRKIRGRFRSWDDVESIHGVGKALLEKIQAEATLGGADGGQEGRGEQESGQKSRAAQGGKRAAKAAEQKAEGAKAEEAQKAEPPKAEAKPAAAEAAESEEAASAAEAEESAEAAESEEAAVAAEAETGATAEAEGEAEEEVRAAGAREEEEEEEDEEEEEGPELMVLMALAEMDLGAAQAYEIGAGAIEDEEISQALLSFRDDHLRHVDNLERLASAMGGEPLDRDRAGDSLLARLAEAAAELGEEATIMAMIAHEQLTNSTYGSIIELGWEDEVKLVLQRNFEDEQRHLEFLEENRERVVQQEEAEEEEERPGAGS